VKPPVETVKCLCLGLTKPPQILQWHEVSHIALLSVRNENSLVFPPHKLFSGSIFTNMGQLYRQLPCKLLHICESTHEKAHSISEHFEYMKIADTTESQKSEDNNITDKLL